MALVETGYRPVWREFPGLCAVAARPDRERPRLRPERCRTNGPAKTAERTLTPSLHLIKQKARGEAAEGGARAFAAHTMVAYRVLGRNA